MRIDPIMISSYQEQIERLNYDAATQLKLPNVDFDHLDSIERQQSISAKAQENLAKKVSPYYQSSLLSMNPNKANEANSSKSIQGTTDRKASVFDGFFNWVKRLFGYEKTEAASDVKEKETNAPVSGTEVITSRPELKPPHKEIVQSMKETNRLHSRGMEEEFDINDKKFTDAFFTKLLVECLKLQQNFREKDSGLALNKVQEEQEDIKELHQKRMNQNKELEGFTKQSKFHASVDPIIQAGTVIGYAITGAFAIAGAATIATGGTLSPILGLTALFNGVFLGIQTVNSFFKNRNEINLKKHEGVSLKLNEEKNMIQFELKVSLDDMKQAWKQWNEVMESLGKIVREQAENKITFK